MNQYKIATGERAYCIRADAMTVDGDYAIFYKDRSEVGGLEIVSVVNLKSTIIIQEVSHQSEGNKDEYYGEKTDKID